MTPEIYEQMLKELRGSNTMSERTLATFREFRDKLIEKFAVGNFKRRLIAKETFDSDKLYSTTDPYTWAESFVKLNQGLPINDSLTSTMMMWFKSYNETIAIHNVGRYRDG